MRPFWNHLGDPGLHLLAIALLVAYLAFGRESGDDRPAAPLPRCGSCHLQFIPGNGHQCRPAGQVAHALP